MGPNAKMAIEAIKIRYGNVFDSFSDKVIQD